MDTTTNHPTHWATYGVDGSGIKLRGQVVIHEHHNDETVTVEFVTGDFAGTVETIRSNDLPLIGGRPVRLDTSDGLYR